MRCQVYWVRALRYLKLVVLVIVKIKDIWWEPHLKNKIKDNWYRVKTLAYGSVQHFSQLKTHKLSSSSWISLCITMISLFLVSEILIYCTPLILKSRFPNPMFTLHHNGWKSCIHQLYRLEYCNYLSLQLFKIAERKLKLLTERWHFGNFDQ